MGTSPVGAGRGWQEGRPLGVLPGAGPLGRGGTAEAVLPWGARWALGVPGGLIRTGSVAEPGRVARMLSFRDVFTGGNSV